jgi:hypothetical protein
VRDLGIADRLRAAGLRVEEVNGWKERGSSTFNPRGVMWHHTASAKGRDAPSLGVVTYGRPDLAGPLCHVLVSRSGICHVVASGRANHAGVGAYAPAGGGSNSTFYGIESENTGYGTGPNAEPWPSEQLDVIARASAALINWDMTRISACCQHREYAPNRKVDMHTVTGDTMRNMTRVLCESHNVPTPPTPPISGYQKDAPMFMISEGLGLFFLANGKVCQFGTPQEFNKARESAPSIPTVVLPIPQAKALIGE